ncbi:hypothetical protein Ciccas_008154 [Cichlidogyrus casuarinus]|uniref:Cation efflux protein transmembrane domain-containing protein n=1 Tax=Cichlidogyrus casuarinus TaxID=1844966 RepID=A0ABD2Q0S7_9PLAT
MLLKAFAETGKDLMRVVAVICEEIKQLIRFQLKARRLLNLLCLLLCFLNILAFFCYYTQSILIAALFGLNLFDFLCLCVSILCLWSEKKSCSFEDHPFGHDRFAVLGMFSTLIVSILYSFFLFKEGMERVLEPADISIDFILPLALISIMLHHLVVHKTYNPALAHITDVCDKNIFQCNLTDVSQSLQQIIPKSFPLKLPQSFNTLDILGYVTLSCCVYAYLSIATTEEYVIRHAGHDEDHLPLLNSTDTVFTMLLAIVNVITLLPMTNYCGRILLQTAPGRLLGPINYALRECSHYDGVLEIKKDHFWETGFHRVAGSLHVRVRSDADEQLILAKITERLSVHVHLLTVQVYKGEWTQRIANSHCCSDKHQSCAHAHGEPGQCK